MMFDAEVAVLTATIGTPSPDALESGAPPTVELGILAGLTMPIPNPQTGQPLVIPGGKLRFTFTREQAMEIFQAALAAAEALPEKMAPTGKLAIANSMADVAVTAESIKRVIGRRLTG